MVYNWNPLTGQFRGSIKVFLPDSDADLAVLRSYREISEKHLDLPDGAVRHGDRLKVTGFGSGATRSETVPLRVESAGAERLIQGKRLQHLIVGKLLGIRVFARVILVPRLMQVENW